LTYNIYEAIAISVKLAKQILCPKRYRLDILAAQPPLKCHKVDVYRSGLQWHSTVM
jgi:hypothetical protein